MITVLIGIAGMLLVLDASRTENPVLLLAGKVWAGLCVAAGVLTLLAVRPLLDAALRMRAGHMVDEAFCLWATGKFDRFFIGSLVVTGLFLWGMLWVVRRKNENNFVWRHLYGMSHGYMALLLAVFVWYGLGTVNKLFDLAAWIGVVVLAECGVLYLPLFLRLWQMNRQKKPV